MRWNNLRVLVTGGAGLIGSRIVIKLLERGASVKVLDNLSAYPFDQPRHFGLERLEVDLISGDIADLKTVRENVKDVDFVFHEAAFADVAATIWNPVEDFHSNVVGTFNLLKSSLDEGVQRFIFASSAAIYGDKPRADGNPPIFTEETKPEPISTYANSKLWAELESLLFYKFYGLKTTCLRYFSIYGIPQVPKERSHSWVVGIFTMRAIKGKSLIIFGGGQQVRDFVYMDDVAEATIRAAEANGSVGEVINVGSGRPTTIKRLADLVVEIGNFKVPIEYGPRPKGDPLGGYADVSKMKKILEWEPKIRLEEGLDRYIKWCLGNKYVIPEWL